MIATTLILEALEDKNPQILGDVGCTLRYNKTHEQIEEKKKLVQRLKEERRERIAQTLLDIENKKKEKEFVERNFK